ncbi:monovalent cation:H+ antiporter, CPA1 (nhx1) [Malassezia vespertilionis]|uniref:Sodium/hydrogen exchanger n=1 Tax=Malassezia vespertilionis TaxID=2020962 RepID=A0A2N1JE97_9BASI|nr:monovalent cation:H+ antiporter, CPA1 (nhx1) [Malassezia vespertilionis]PKI84864.1 Nhx1p [Malassezia vespertilionis]WFD05527.1 monovalent cation:H+ antiporter, CPA1 (nhx1) [Malassezia vespertilionis]
MSGAEAGVSAQLPSLDAEENERFSSLALFLVLFLLIGSFLTSYYLRVRRITAVHETIVGLFAGMFVGIVLRIGPLRPVREMLGFSNVIMMNVLLPPIILASGYHLRQAKFFRNFGTILSFALAGTFISAVVIGVIVWIGSFLHIERARLSLLDCLIFGSTLSATDPVTILAIFTSYKVDPQLYSIIFGESILNDAVSIVMFETLLHLRNQTITLWSIFYGFGFFALVFSFSVMLGVVFGLACSLTLKHSHLGSYPELESCIVILIAYSSYFFSNAVQMSGIVSLLFCGITLKHYAHGNMSFHTQRTTKAIFQTLASLSENFIFIYLGLSLFTGAKHEYMPMLIIFTLVAVVVSRYCAVFPIAYLLNRFAQFRARRRQRGAGAGVPVAAYELSHEYQLMLFWAGLRGAVGFALSAGIQGENASMLQTTVLVTVVLTVIVFGGTTAQMLDILHIQTGVDDDEDDVSAAGDEEAPDTQPWMYNDVRPPAIFPADDRYRDMSTELSVRQADENEVLPDAAGPVAFDASVELADDDASTESRSVRMLDTANLIFKDGEWFQRIDERYLLPMFSNTVANRKREQRKEARRAVSHEQEPNTPRSSSPKDKAH